MVVTVVMLCNKHPLTSVVYNNEYVFPRSVGQQWFCRGQLGLLVFDLTLVLNSGLLHLLYIPVGTERYASKPIHTGTLNTSVGVTLVILLVKSSHIGKIKEIVAGMNMLPPLLGGTEKSCGKGCEHIIL